MDAHPSSGGEEHLGEVVNLRGHDGVGPPFVGDLTGGGGEDKTGQRDLDQEGDAPGVSEREGGVTKSHPAVPVSTVCTPPILRPGEKVMVSDPT